MANFFVFIQFLMKLFDLGERLGKIIGDKNVNDWIASLESAVQKAETAKTIEESQDAAKSLLGAIGGIKR